MNSPNLERALRIKTNSQRGGVIENIYMRNIEIGEVSDALIRINFHYEEGDVGIHTPIVQNIDIENTISQKSKYVLLMDGYKRSPIKNIRISDCEFNGVKEVNVLNHVKGLKMKNVRINGIQQ